MWWFVLFACSDPAPPGASNDADGDGWSAPEDCDDGHPRVHPGAEETWYDGVDQDCDGADDFDQDGDGDRLLAAGGSDCDDVDPSVTGLDSDADGVSTCDGDCDDDDDRAVPGGPAVCGDGVDSDCDGVPDCQMSGERDVLTGSVAVIDSGGRSFGAVLATADLDGDGADELLAGGVYLPAVSWWRGPLAGDLTLDDGIELGAPTGALAVHDLDGDGALDLYLEGGSPQSLAFWGPVRPDDGGEVFAWGGSWHVAAGDVTGDGRADLVRAGDMLLGVHSGPDFTDVSGWASLEPGAGWVLDGGVKVHDTDADGVDDILATMDGSVWLIAGPVAPGRGTVVDRGEQIVPRDAVESLVTLDADGDGRADVVGQAYLGPFRVYTAPFDGVQVAAATLPELDAPNQDLIPAAVGDLDDDGFDDFAVGHDTLLSPASVVTVFHGPLVGDTPRITRFVADHHKLRGITAGDLTGDGADDLVLALDDDTRPGWRGLFIVPGEPSGW
ncbi:MAG: hypothetical protein ACI9K2_002864 [Myxococcota bacterium]|jgi:hypothetical protein